MLRASGQSDHWVPSSPLILSSLFEESSSTHPRVTICSPVRSQAFYGRVVEGKSRFSLEPCSNQKSCACEKKKGGKNNCTKIEGSLRRCELDPLSMGTIARSAW